MSRPLLKRPLDLFYFVFLVFNIFTFIFVDGQNFYPSNLIPHFMKQIVQDYLRDSGDPFVQALHKNDLRYIWFATSMQSELYFQVPIFVFGSWFIWKDDKRIYPVLISYGLLASFTTLQCLTSVMYGNDGESLFSNQKSYLLKAYIPFTIIPFLMMCDMTVRCWQLIGQKDEERTKKLK